ncbi:MAG: hypothetical protein SVT52_08950 [Planctomycetota bacterium]|nr:hypothetical protein [Planctomycetota bacterium]
MHEHMRDNSGITETIFHELRHHVPFTFFGALTGVAIALVFAYAHIPHKVSHALFATFHPGHVFVSAIATTAMYRLHGRRSVLSTILVGFIGSVGIGTISDSLIPYLGELVLGAPHAHVHIGFIEEWYLVIPLALLGVAVAYWRPTTEIPHAAHVLLSTWASLFHMLMALGVSLGMSSIMLIPAFLFLAVWVPCCTSDIVFPLLFGIKKKKVESDDKAAQPTEGSL